MQFTTRLYTFSSTHLLFNFIWDVNKYLLGISISCLTISPYLLSFFNYKFSYFIWDIFILIIGIIDLLYQLKLTMHEFFYNFFYLILFKLCLLEFRNAGHWGSSNFFSGNQIVPWDSQYVDSALEVEKPLFFTKPYSHDAALHMVLQQSVLLCLLIPNMEI
jgi:hypothetical protein